MDSNGHFVVPAVLMLLPNDVAICDVHVGAAIPRGRVGVVVDYVTTVSGDLTVGDGTAPAVLVPDFVFVSWVTRDFYL